MKKKIITKKAQKVLNKLLEKEKCPYCHCNLLEEGIGWAEKGIQFFEVELVQSGKNAYLDYDSDEFNRTGECWFLCRNCGEPLDFIEDEVIELLENDQFNLH